MDAAAYSGKLQALLSNLASLYPTVGRVFGLSNLYKIRYLLEMLLS